MKFPNLKELFFGSKENGRVEAVYQPMTMLGPPPPPIFIIQSEERGWVEEKDEVIAEFTGSFEQRENQKRDFLIRRGLLWE